MSCSQTDYLSNSQHLSRVCMERAVTSNINFMCFIDTLIKAKKSQSRKIKNLCQNARNKKNKQSKTKQQTPQTKNLL